jgi:hypothetical protein
MSLAYIVPIFLYLSIGMHASVFVEIVGILCVIPFYVLSLLSGLGRTLVIFMSCLVLLSLGLTMRIG